MGSLLILSQVISIKIIFLIALGTFGGFFIGAIPGLTVSMATALLVSLTYPWNPLEAIALMMGVWVGGFYAGNVSAVLINIPGAPAAIASTFDGYPLAKKGHAGEAIAMGAIQSSFGTVIGLIILIIAAPVIAKFALGFGPYEYFLLAVFGLTIIGSLSAGKILKGLIAGIFGVLIGLVGMDPVYGVGRFTYGSVYLLGGIHFIPVLIGLFGISEVLEQLGKETIKKIPASITKIKISFKELKKYASLTLKSGVIGSLIGALPGAGGTIACLVAYDHAKRTVKNPDVPFGEGAHEGIVAPESANNACVGGALIPMLTLGIPGDAVSAIIIGAFSIHGLRPGPLFMKENPEMFNVIVFSGFVAAIFLVLYGLGGARFFAKVITVRKEILLPLILIICVVGAYAVERNVFHIFIMFTFGIIGYIMRKTGFAVGPVILGIILGPIADSNLRRALDLNLGNVWGTIVTFFARPVCVILIIAILYTLISNSKFLQSKFKLFLKR